MTMRQKGCLEKTSDSRPMLSTSLSATSESFFGIKPDDYLCKWAPSSLSTSDDELYHQKQFSPNKEAEFFFKSYSTRLLYALPPLRKFLNQNPRTLLPKFYGLYCLQSGGIKHST
ncbi:unnamed protein product [Ranitomeya imitator]|uniref:Maturase K n=1 Tax=Ranitomeya imitator TaxID=111125 RepID=A0ABN9LI62_9NEOB|nr:unnamed protein product [Ranitomeya imitator]